MGNAAGGMEGGPGAREPRDARDARVPVPPPSAAAPPPARQPMPAAAELEERFGRVLVSGAGGGGQPRNRPGSSLASFLHLCYPCGYCVS